ncbi:MAG: hypothetical protein NTZ73_04405 [Candidatus Diapherotrites archaeon]|nr:hypothetical protein [Candidatus Diapherotrites archaeon]
MPTHAYLTNVAYREEKQQVLAEFSDESKKAAHRFTFFPFINFSTKLSNGQLEDLLLSLGIKKFKVSGENEKKRIETVSFSELKKISNVFARAFGEKPLLLEPERQFLLENKWKFFDEFELTDFGPMKTKNYFSDIGFFLTKKIPFGEAVRIDEDGTVALVEKAALSRILSVKMENAPESSKDATEIFLENMYFKTGMPFTFKENEKFYAVKEFAPLGHYENISEIDFSPVWAQMFTKNFFNIGLETKNCSCCSPITVDDKNLYPDSMIEVIFNEDAVFFESSSNNFSKKFHDEKPFHEARLEKRREFFLKNYPVGPFFNGQKELVPLGDAKRLLTNEKASFGKNHLLSWFCKNEESFFSKEISGINSEIVALNSYVEKSGHSLFTKTDPVYWFSMIQARLLGGILMEIPFQLMNLNSKFFSPSIAGTINSVQESTICKFKEFSEKRGYRVLYADQKGAFVRGFSSLALAKSFSKEYCLPQPEIRAFSLSSKIERRNSRWA